MPLPQRVVIQTMVDTHSSYGQLFVELFSGFLRRGIEVAVRPIHTGEVFGAVPYLIKERFTYSIQPDEWEILVCPLSYGLYPTPKKKTVYFSMWETTALGVEQVRALSRAHAIVVPSKWNKRMFELAGILTPIYVVPLGVSPEIFSYRPMNMEGPCIFNAGGRWVNPEFERKGTAQIVTAFTRAFQDSSLNAKLSIKTFPDEKYVSPHPKIEVIKSVWSWDLMLHWMMKSTAFVHSGQEGWGLMQHQSMAVGRPLLGPLWGAGADFQNLATTYPVKFEMVDAGWLYRNLSGGKWPVMDTDNLAEEMRRVYFDREEARGKGMAAAISVETLTWDNTVTKFLDVLEVLGVLS